MTQKTGIHCAWCGKAIPYSEYRWMRDRAVCPSCKAVEQSTTVASNDFLYCAWCGDATPRVGATFLDDRVICPPCEARLRSATLVRNGLRHCGLCGKAVAEGEEHYLAHQVVCPACEKRLQEDLADPLVTRCGWCHERIGDVREAGSAGSPDLPHGYLCRRCEYGLQSYFETPVRDHYRYVILMIFAVPAGIIAGFLALLEFF